MMEAIRMERAELSKRLKQFLVKNGLGHLRVQLGRGTAWDWIDIWCAKGAGSFSEDDRQKLETLLGRDWGRTNCICMKLFDVEAKLNKAEFNSPGLEALKSKFYLIGPSFQDSGGCCGGSGLKIFKDDKIVDFWRNTFGQSTSPVYGALMVLRPEIEALGFTARIEEGWVD
jgi:hypothetical protein